MTTTNATTGPRDEIGMVRAGLAGALAAAAALSAGELAAALAAPRPGPVVAVANRVVDNAPTWFVDFGKRVFGLADKPALVLGTIIISVVIAIGLGIASRRSPLPGVAGIAGFGLVGMTAIGVDSQGGWGAAVPISLAAMVAGVVALVVLMALAGAGRAPVGPARRTEGDEAEQAKVTDSPVDPAVSRRGFLNAAGIVGVSAAAATAGANVLRSRSTANDAREAVQLDSALTATELESRIADAGTSDLAATPGLTPLIVPNDDFYLIDTAILTPQVDPADWQLTVGGMVDNEVTYSYQELLDRASMVEPVTLSCVSNEVGGTLVGNAVWQGVPLTEILDQAGVHPRATQIASRSVDGWSCGFPTDLAYDGRTAMVAVAMNDEPLPLRHGFPARLVVSGLYGYVSATKWLSEIELTTLEAFDGYWIPRGWSKLGPVKTQSRIDTPRRSTSLPAGQEVPIAGVAWAPSLGIERVEVQIDSEPWQEAELGESLGVHAWRQWRLTWTPTEGRHLIRVRATDGSGQTQTSDTAPPAPSGATGWHEIAVNVN
jgi:DMSO/TMAO reductase YedYZ molybdopterin-dependent catalytic subunit